MIKASVYIICKNEEKHIKRVLESVKEFTEIIIVDSGSIDNTLEIAKNYTDNIYHQEWMGFAKQKELEEELNRASEFEYDKENDYEQEYENDYNNQ